VFNNHAGINLAETKLQIVEITYKTNSFYLENVDQTFHTEKLDPSVSESKMISILQESFKRISKKKSLISKNVSFAIPNNFFKIFEVPYDDSLVKKDLYDHFRWEISILFPDCDPDNFYIQHIQVDKTEIRKEKCAVIFAIDKTIVSVINKFCLYNNLTLKYIDNAHLASNAFLYLDKKNEERELSLSIYIDQNYSSIAALEGVHPFYFDVIRPPVQNIFDSLISSISKIEAFNLSIADFSSVFFYGQDLTEEFESKMRSHFNIPIKKIDPFERLKVDEAVYNNTFYKVKSNSFTAAAGIAIRII
jgi:Tfp pilus assembly PilM family ATPase